MKYYPVSHGSDEWFECRRGMPTSSCFDKIITPGGKFSSQSGGYQNLLIAELILGHSLDKFPPSYWMERGAVLEAEAADLYAFETGHTLDRGGFITDDLGRWGCSPDRRIIGEDGQAIGAVEIKCPAPWTHVENILSKSIDKKYYPQVQGQMLVGGFDFVDWFSYHPDMPPSLVRTYRDEDYINSLKTSLEMFTEELDEKLQRLVEIGAISEFPNKIMPDITDALEEFIEDGESFTSVFIAG